ncbi:MAG: glycosyltransferase family 4 protein [Luteolibacter sp.]
MLTGFRRERGKIRRLVKKLKPDLIHAWGTESGYAMAALDSPIPKLLSMQGILSHYCETAPHPFFTRIQARAERRDLPKFRDITVESPWGIEQVRRRAPHAHLHHVEYGVDPALFEIERAPADKPIALFVGTLNTLKGVDTLLTAFQHPSLAHVELRLLGDGPLRDSVSAPNITFLGYRSHEEVISEMRRAWCLVHPTLADTSPNCVKEARVLGLPVVTTPNGGQTQYVTHRQSGWIHEAGASDPLIEGVRFLTMDRQSSISYGEHGKTDCRTALSAVTCADRFTSLYRQIEVR